MFPVKDDVWSNQLSLEVEGRIKGRPQQITVGGSKTSEFSVNATDNELVRMATQLGDEEFLCLVNDVEWLSG